MTKISRGSIIYNGTITAKRDNINYLALTTSGGKWLPPPNSPAFSRVFPGMTKIPSLMCEPDTGDPLTGQLFLKSNIKTSIVTK